MNRIPGLTGLLVAIALAIQWIPGAAAALALDRGGLHGWSALTGHLTHWSFNHLGWDLAVFAVLAGWLELRNRAHTAWVLLVGAAAISLAFWWLVPGLDSYRGLSGLDAALVGAVVVQLSRDAQTRFERVLPSCMGAALALKVVAELVTGDALFASADGWVPVPLAHAVGGLIGAAVWYGLGRSRNPRVSCVEGEPCTSERALSRPPL